MRDRRPVAAAKSFADEGMGRIVMCRRGEKADAESLFRDGGEGEFDLDTAYGESVVRYGHGVECGVSTAGCHSGCGESGEEDSARDGFNHHIERGAN